MKKFKQTLIQNTSPIRQAIESIDKSAMQIALIVDKKGRLQGTVTDGDVRRGVLKGVSIEEPVEKIMRRKFICVKPDVPRKNLANLFKSKGIHQIPVVDEAGRVVGIEIIDEQLTTGVRQNEVILMAGGLGKRLSPLTDDCPKPLLHVGKKPILETILDNFIEHGFRNFRIAVNYKNELIQDYFGDGSQWNVNIRYLNEKERRGTAGALADLKDIGSAPFIVMNADLLTKVNFSQLLSFHSENKAQATMCVREYDFQVPYGVVRLERNCVSQIDEKPIQKMFVNAGIYVFEPDAVRLIPKKKLVDMPEIFSRLIEEKFKVSAFPLREYWMDIGHRQDLKRADVEFSSVFG